ncbi:MAG: glycosyltransferase family 1 protein, partial [Chloroflexota bacterium]
VITANTSSLAELSATGGALAIDPKSAAALKDAVFQVLHDGKLRDNLIAAGYDNVQRFSWQQAAETILHLMEKQA